LIAPNAVGRDQSRPYAPSLAYKKFIRHCPGALACWRICRLVSAEKA
jgi:hypothetical protein